jgi:hypothetical protein
VREVRASRRPRGETKANRYTLQTEIAATSTKQTADTRVNRYKNRPWDAEAPGEGAFAPFSPRARNSNNESAIRNRRK